MPTNSLGKVFEQDFKESCKRHKYWIMRIRDTYYMNSQVNKLSTVNPFDFLLFDDEGGQLYALELKSTQYKSIGFQLTPDDPDSMIHAHQIKGLLDTKQGFKNIHAGFLFQFRETEMVYYMEIDDFLDFAASVDRKSITPSFIVQYGGKVVNSKKLRTHYTFDITQMVKDINNDEKRGEI